MGAYEKLRELDLRAELDERCFLKIISEFKNDYLDQRQYREKVEHHRKAAELMEELLQQSYLDLRKIGERQEMQDIEINNGSSVMSYVYTRVRRIWEADKRLNLYSAIKEYCLQSGKDFNTTIVHLAEYRALERVATKIRSDQRKLNLQKKYAEVSVKKEPTYISGLSGIRDYILGSMQSDKMMNLATLRHIIPKPLSPFEFLEKVGWGQNTLTDVDNIFRRLEPIRPTIIDGNTFLTMLAIAVVSRMNAGKYYTAFNYIEKTAIDMTELKNFTHEFPSLVEMQYEFLPEVEELEAPKQDSEQRIILLNQSKRIRDVILDIYKNNANLLQVGSRQFEEMIAELLSSQGFKVELTKQTRDGGYDIIALYEMANQSPLKWLVECKKWNGKVGVEIIRSFKEVVQSQHANKGIIATTGYFTRDAIIKQQETPYLLDFKDKDGVMKWITTYANQNFKA